jgi:putative colanic acid biosynthesis glycosyltransferase
MKILQVNCVYKKESTGKIVYDIHTLLQQGGFNSIVCYGRGEKIEEKGIYKVCGEWYSKANNALSRINGLMYGGCFFSTRKLVSILEKEKPDIVHIHCINGYFINIYRLISYLRDNNYKVVLTLHAEFMYTGNCGYALECNEWLTGCGKCPRLRRETKSLLFDRTSVSWNKMKDAFSDFDNHLLVVSVSPWLMERAKKSPILADKKHRIVLNGIDTENVFHITNSSLRKQLGCEGKKVILHVTASFSRPIKGGKYVIELAKRMPEYFIVLVGNKERNLDLPANIIDVGYTENQRELAAYYTMADILLLTSEKETFSMPVAESLCCGTPVVGFRAGAPEQIALPEYSEFVEYGDINTLEATVRTWIETSIDKKALAEKAKQVYSKEKMVQEYIVAYNDLLQQN